MSMLLLIMALLFNTAAPRNHQQYAVGMYWVAVFEDGDCLNDWLTHMSPEAWEANQMECEAWTH